VTGDSWTARTEPRLVFRRGIREDGAFLLRAESKGVASAFRIPQDCSGKRSHSKELTVRGARKHTGLGKKGRTKRGHCQQNLDLEITASVTICQVRNKGCELNGLRESSRRNERTERGNGMWHGMSYRVAKPKGCRLTCSARRERSCVRPTSPGSARPAKHRGRLRVRRDCGG
jgi:hypothetical protein